MREIKFRGKRLDNKEWVYGHYFITPITAEFCVKPENGAFFASGDEPIRHCIVENMVAFEIDHATIGQYTGLKDKNGKEIWEEDIVCGSPQRVVGEVVYHNDRIEIKDDDPQYWVGVNFFSQEGREIIGNIHDNTELLKTE